MATVTKSQQSWTVLSIVFFGLVFSAEAYDCYKCSAAKATDSCASNIKTLTGDTNKEACGIAGRKCFVRREVDKDGNFTSLERGCNFEFGVFGGKSKCVSTSSGKKCLVVCSSAMCNDVTEKEVESCANSNCKGGASLSIPFSSALLLIFSVMARVFY